MTWVAAPVAVHCCMKVLVKQRRRHPQCNQKARPWQKPTMDAGPDFHPCTRHIHNFEIGWYARSSHFPTHPCREKAAVARSPKQVEHLGVSFEARYRFKKGRLWRGAPNKTTNWLGSPSFASPVDLSGFGFSRNSLFFFLAREATAGLRRAFPRLSAPKSKRTL